MKFLLIALISIGTANAIIGGRLANPGERKAVLQISIESGEDSGMCTATKVSHRYILTAAHCFDGFKLEESTFGISTAAINPDFAFEHLNVKNIHLHPSYVPEPEEDDDTDYNQLSTEMIWQHSHFLLGIDVALVEVEPSGLFAALPIEHLSFEEIVPGETIEFWGYGCQKTVNNTDDYFPLRKVALAFSVDSKILREDFGAFRKVIRTLEIPLYQAHVLTLGTEFDPKSPSGCFGDSGGPAFLNGKIVAVNTGYFTRGMNKEGQSTSGLATVNLHVRLSRIKNWLESYLGTL